MPSITSQKRPMRSSASVSCLSLLLLIIFHQKSNGFQTISISTSIKSRLYVSAIEPGDIPAILSTTHIAANQIASVLTSNQHSIAHLHSIAPSIEAMKEMGASYAGTNAAAGDAASIQHVFPNAAEALQARFQTFNNAGWHIMDASKIFSGGGSTLPGFTKTGTLLGTHAAILGQEPISFPRVTPDFDSRIFEGKIDYMRSMLSVLEKLPYAAFLYVFIEFFFLRSDVDIYKEDIEDDSAGVFAESVSDLGVRMGIIAVVAIATVATSTIDVI